MKGSTMLKKILGALGALALLSAGVIGSATGASAHTPSVSATCSTLTVSLEYYNGTNSGSLEVDGAVVLEGEFGDSFYQEFDLGDPYVSHTWKVRVRAHDDPTGEHGWSFNQSGTTTPCERPKPEQPGPVTGTDSGSDEPVCVEGTTTSTTTSWTQDWSQEYVWNDEAWDWVLGDKVYADQVFTTSEPAADENCTVPPVDEPPVVTPPVVTPPVVVPPVVEPPVVTPPVVEIADAVPTPVPTTAPVADSELDSELAETGSEGALALAGIATLAVLGGGGAVVLSRRRSQRV